MEQFQKDVTQAVKNAGKEAKSAGKELKKGAKDLIKLDFPTFDSFYPYYLKEHSNRTNRRLHVIGTLLAVVSLFTVVATKQWQLLFLPFVVGYGFAWVGHFFFEKNKPATFKYPLYSFRGDWRMLYQVLTGKIKF